MCKIHLVLTIICFLILGFSGISLVAVGPGWFAEGNPSWGAASLLFLSPGLLPLCPRPQHPLPRAPLGRPGVLWGQPGAPQTPPLGALSDVLSSVTEVCAGHQIDRRGPHSDGLMPRAEKLQPCRPHLPRIRNPMKSLSNSNL